LNVVFSGLGYALSLITVIFITKNYGVDFQGYFSQFRSGIEIFTTVLLLGLGTSIIPFLQGKNLHLRAINSLIYRFLFIWAVLVLLFYISNKTLFKTELFDLVFFATVYLSVVIAFIRSLSLIYSRAFVFNVIGLIQPSILLLVLIVSSFADLIEMKIFYLIATTTTLLLILAILARYPNSQRFKNDLSQDSFRKIFKISTWVYFYQVLILFLPFIAYSSLIKIGDTHAAGFLSIFLLISNSISFPFNTIFHNLLNHFSSFKFDRKIDVLGKLLKAIIIYFTVASLFLFIFSNYFLEFLSPNLEISNLYLSILIIYSLFFTLNRVITSYFLSFNKDYLNKKVFYILAFKILFACICLLLNSISLNNIIFIISISEFIYFVTNLCLLLFENNKIAHKIAHKIEDVSPKRILWLHNFDMSGENNVTGCYVTSFYNSFVKLNSDFSVKLIYVGKLNYKNLFHVIKVVLLQKKNYDLLHCQYGSMLGLLVSILAPHKTVISLRGSDFYSLKLSRNINLSEYIHSKASYFLTRLSFLFCKNYIVMSEKMKLSSPNFYHKNTAVIPDPVRDSFLRKKYIYNYRAKIKRGVNIGFIAANPNSSVKNLNLAEEAYKFFSKNNKGNFKIYYGLNPNSINKVYDNLDILLLTSQHEGFPNVIKEAIYAGVPFVSTDVSDLQKYADLGFGIVCRSEPNVLADAIYKILANPKNYNKGKINDFDPYPLSLKLRNYYLGILKMRMYK
jgi:teichuronic acid biosynthesis glycosyltransferase TuaC